VQLTTIRNFTGKPPAATVSSITNLKRVSFKTSENLQKLKKKKNQQNMHMQKP